MNGEGVPSARKSEVTFLEDGLKHAHQMNRLLNVNLTDRDQICEMAVEIIKELSEVPEIPEEIRKGLKALQAKLAPIDVLQPALGAGTQQWEAGYSEEHVEQVQSDRNWYYQKLMEVIFRCQGQGGSRWKSESKSSMDEPSSDKPIALKTARSTIMEMREKERAALAAEWPWEKLQAFCVELLGAFS